MRADFELMLPREISVEHWPERTTFTLPVRPLGRLRFLGLVVMAVGLAFAIGPITMFWPVLSPFVHGHSRGFEWLLLVPLALFLVFAQMPMGMGLFMLVGQCRIAVGRDRIVAAEFAGPIFWRRKVRVKQILRLEVGGPPTAGASPLPAAFIRVGSLTAVLQSGKRVVLALGYPPEWIHALAQEVSAVLKLEGAPLAVTDHFGTRIGPAGAVPEIVPQPEGSRVEVVETGSGIQVAVPSRGLWKASSGLLLFGAVWTMMTAVVTVGSVLKGPGSHGDFSLPGLIAFLAVFWAVGLFMLLFGFHLGTQKWSIEVRPEGLVVTAKSILRSRVWQWRRGEVLRVRVGDSRVEVNHRPLRELQIQIVGGKPLGLLAGRDEAELAWLAGLLGRHLGTQ